MFGQICTLQPFANWEDGFEELIVKKVPIGGNNKVVKKRNPVVVFGDKISESGTAKERRDDEV